MNKMLLIRADASVTIGTGHVMRCIALAQAWQERGGRVTLLTHRNLPPALNQRCMDEGMQIVVLDTEPGSTADAQYCIQTAQHVGAVWVVVDGYHFDAKYQDALKAANLKLLFVDDNGHAAPYSADFVLNQNVYAHESLYKNRAPHTQLLLGTAYTLLRREFRQQSVKREINTEVRRILVTLGGSDPYNVTQKVIEALRGEPYDVVVVISGSHPNLKILETLVVGTNIEIHLDVHDMSALMLWADLAVTACGTTLWELAFMRLPSIGIIIAPNQQRNAAWLQQHEAVLILGEADHISSVDIRAAVTELTNTPARRQYISRMLQSLIDGAGVQRVLGVLEDNSIGLQLRPVHEKDIALIWRWANDAQTRANSFRSGIITWQDHVQWYQRQLAAPDVRFWMLEDCGVPVGHIRYVREDKVAIINFTVAPEHRGCGYGTQLLRMSRAAACKTLNVDRLRGITLEQNHASARAFEKADFKLIHEQTIENHSCFIFEWECKQ